RRLQRMFTALFPFDPLTEDQIQTIKGLLHKVVVIRRRRATAASSPRGKQPAPNAVTLDVLDARQEQPPRSMSDGQQVVFGVAGSGKTVMLLARARMLASRDPAARVLVLCYNKALAACLSEQMAGDPAARNIKARHFHSWAARKTGLRLRDD